MRDDDINIESDQFHGEIRKTAGLACGPPVLDAEVLAFNVAVIAQSMSERLDRGRILYSPRGAQDADPRDLPRLLSPRGERCDNDARTHQADERSPVHHSWLSTRLITAPHEHVIQTRSCSIPVSSSPQYSCSRMKASKGG